MGIKENKKQNAILCNHDINDSNSTLICLPKRRLTHPNILDYYCPICHGCFKYTMDSENNLSLLKD